MADYTLKKVDYNPFEDKESGVKLTPVQGNPFKKAPSGNDDTKQYDTGGDFISTMTSETPIPEFSPEAVSKMYTPVLEGLGSAGGGVVGAYGGPASPLTVPLAGAGGYVIGKNTAELIDNIIGARKPKTVMEEISDVPSEATAGLAYEMIPVVAKGIYRPVKSGGSWVFKKAKDFTKGTFTKAGQEKLAGEVLVAHLSDDSAIYVKNVQEAKAIEKEIPGLKFTLSERTGDSAITGLERSKQLSNEKYEQMLKNSEAMRKYYSSKFGSSGIDDLITSVQNSEEVLAATAKQTQAEVNALAESMPINDPSVIGENILETLKVSKASTKAKSEFLYQAVDDMDINIVGLKKELKEILKKTSKAELDKNIPDVLKDSIELYKGDVEKLSELRGLRTSIFESLRSSQKSATPNLALEKRLNRAVSAIEKAISEAEGNEGTKLALKEANRFYRQSYVEVFRQRGVGELLRRGASGEASKVPIEKIPGKIWSDKKSLYYANSVKKAVGDAADPIMKEYATFDMLESTKDINGDISGKALTKWLSKNEKILKKFNIYDDFKTLEKAQSISDGASDYLKSFQKDVAKNVLGADPERVIAKTLSGGNSIKKTKDILNAIRGDKVALKGYQNAFADHVMSTVKAASEDMALKPTLTNDAIERALRKHDSVMRILFRGDPEKMNALTTMRRAFQLASRSSRIKASGKIEEDVIKVGGPSLLKREVVIAKWLGRIVNKYRDYQVDRFVTRALFDPDYAQVLIDGAKQSADNVKIDNKISKMMIDLFKERTAQFGLVSTTEAAKGDGGKGQ